MDIREAVRVPEEISMFDGRLKIGFQNTCTESAEAVFYRADGDLVFEDPFFEPQPRLDPKEGFSFDINSEAGEATCGLPAQELVGETGICG